MSRKLSSNESVCARALAKQIHGVLLMRDVTLLTGHGELDYSQSEAKAMEGYVAELIMMAEKAEKWTDDEGEQRLGATTRFHARGLQGDTTKVATPSSMSMVRRLVFPFSGP